MYKHLIGCGCIFFFCRFRFALLMLAFADSSLTLLLLVLPCYRALFTPCFLMFSEVDQETGIRNDTGENKSSRSRAFNSYLQVL